MIEVVRVREQGGIIKWTYCLAEMVKAKSSRIAALTE